MYRYRYMANLVMIIHFLIATMIIGGTLLMFWFRSWVPYHLALVGVTMMHNLTSERCVFTVWEEKLRKKYNKAFELKTDFVGTYLSKIADIHISKDAWRRISMVFNTSAILLALILLI